MNRIALLSAALLAASTIVSASPAVAEQPFPTDHLVSNHINPKAMVDGGQPFTGMGTLTAGRYMVVVAAGITDSAGHASNGASTTVTFMTPDGKGASLKQRVLLTNGVPLTVDFGPAANLVGGNEITAIWYTGDKQDNLSMSLSHETFSR